MDSGWERKGDEGSRVRESTTVYEKTSQIDIRNTNKTKALKIQKKKKSKTQSDYIYEIDYVTNYAYLHTKRTEAHTGNGAHYLRIKYGAMRPNAFCVFVMPERFIKRRTIKPQIQRAQKRAVSFYIYVRNMNDTNSAATSKRKQIAL